MTFYQAIAHFGTKIFARHTLFKYAFNLSPMYRRSTARVTYISPDMRNVMIRLPISYRNRNYVGSIFGGSMFSAVDPIPMVQLINLLDDDYIVWDKAAEIRFKRPAKQDLYAEFNYTAGELADIIAEIDRNQEAEITKLTRLTDRDKTRTFCEVEKTLYVSSKANYKAKLKARNASSE